MLWLNSSNAMPLYNDYTVLCGGTRRTHVESQEGKGSVNRSMVLDTGADLIRHHKSCTEGFEERTG